MIVYLLERALKLMKKAPREGCFVEFGVHRGDSLITTIKMANNNLPGKNSFYGFDSFEGMPPSKVPLNKFSKNNWAAGSFSDTSLEFVKQRIKKERLKAKLIKGNFDKLKTLSIYGINLIRFAYIDADIYEGYRDALRKITPHIQIGTVILFDEYFTPSDSGYQDIRYHGKRAVDEWEKETGFNLHLIRFKGGSALFVIVDENYLKNYGFYLELLRNDNLIQSFIDILYQISHRLNI